MPCQFSNSCPFLPLPSLAAQSLVILLLASYYQGRLDAKFAALLALFFAWAAAGLSGVMAPALMSAMQIAATCVLTGNVPSGPLEHHM